MPSGLSGWKLISGTSFLSSSLRGLGSAVMCCCFSHTVHLLTLYARFVDMYVLRTYIGLSAPLLGAVNPLRAVLSGENMGLPINDDVARYMEVSKYTKLCIQSSQIEIWIECPCTHSSSFLLSLEFQHLALPTRLIQSPLRQASVTNGIATTGPKKTPMHP